MALAEALGLDQRSFLDAIEGRPMDSPYAQMKGEKIVSGDLSPAFSLKLATKDVRARGRDGRRRRASTSASARSTLERFERAIELGHGDEDMAAAWFATASAGLPQAIDRPPKRGLMPVDPEFGRSLDV